MYCTLIFLLKMLSFDNKAFKSVNFIDLQQMADVISRWDETEQNSETIKTKIKTMQHCYSVSDWSGNKFIEINAFNIWTKAAFW